MQKYAELLESIEVFDLIIRAEIAYGPYANGNQQRQIMILVDDNGNKKTVSLPRYIWEKHYKEPIPKDLTVDHRDRNHSNNAISNLRLVPRDQHSADDTRRVDLVELVCNQCKTPFKRSPRLLRDKNKKGVRGLFCSRRCSGIFNRKVQLGLAEPLEIQPFIESTYYRNDKHIEATLELFSIKYGS